MIALLILATGASFRTDVFPIPPEYQKNTTAWVQTMTQAQIDHECGTYPGLKTLACNTQSEPYVYMPNPCLFPEAADIASYAHLLCHELAHAQGWKHPDPAH